MSVCWTSMDTPVGRLVLTSDGAGLTGLTMEPQEGRRPVGAAHRADDVLREAVSQLDEYFAGRREVFDLPRSAPGTVFQRTVWEELVKVPFGETVSYGELARRIGRPTAVRAVARANATNPLGIVVPCHRVIGGDGTLTGYAGGLERKRWLLAHEGALLPVGD
ncbi:MAG TPA: methylated-DNA--[protein]-cysteine S-methyltransferase [Egibacteraceae bacterium]|nr:methylated-DNA--[protein]-cysteine S-methyltransferase [Egibacteraceae bacterium]